MKIMYKGRTYIKAETATADKAKWVPTEQGYTLKDSTGDLGSVLEVNPYVWYAYTCEEEPLNRRPFETEEEAMRCLEEKIGITGDKSIVTGRLGKVTKPTYTNATFAKEVKERIAGHFPNSLIETRPGRLTSGVIIYFAYAKDKKGTPYGIFENDLLYTTIIVEGFDEKGDAGEFLVAKMLQGNNAHINGRSVKKFDWKSVRASPSRVLEKIEIYFAQLAQWLETAEGKETLEKYKQHVNHVVAATDKFNWKKKTRTEVYVEWELYDSNDVKIAYIVEHKNGSASSWEVWYFRTGTYQPGNTYKSLDDAKENAIAILERLHSFSNTVKSSASQPAVRLLMQSLYSKIGNKMYMRDLEKLLNEKLPKLEPVESETLMLLARDIRSL